MIKRRSRRQKNDDIAMAEINLTPLIDTALTLLIIFMLTAPMMHNAIKVDLPEGKVREVDNIKEELVVHIKKDGELFFNEKKISLADLPGQIKEVIGSKQNQTVFVKGDEKGNYGSVMEVIDKLKDVGGIKDVALATARHA